MSTVASWNHPRRGWVAGGLSDGRFGMARGIICAAYAGDQMEKATFAGGCFWGVEHLFNEIPGVIDAVSGYTGGSRDNPTYEEVCSGRTGHAEAVEVTFDPAKVSYDELLNAFWNMHDPTTLNSQGPDHGSQYRSAIYFHGAEQETAARKSAEAAQRYFNRPIVTEIVPAPRFWPAEDYHQRCFDKHPGHGCLLYTSDAADDLLCV